MLRHQVNIDRSLLPERVIHGLPGLDDLPLGAHLIAEDSVGQVVVLDAV